MINRGLWAKEAAGPRIATKEEQLESIRQAPRSVKKRHRKLVAEAAANVTAVKAVQAAQIPKEPRGGRMRGKKKR
jgi:hypothetical protein